MFLGVGPPPEIQGEVELKYTVLCPQQSAAKDHTALASFVSPLKPTGETQQQRTTLALTAQQQHDHTLVLRNNRNKPAGVATPWLSRGCPSDLIPTPSSQPYVAYFSRLFCLPFKAHRRNPTKQHNTTTWCCGTIEMVSAAVSEQAKPGSSCVTSGSTVSLVLLSKAAPNSIMPRGQSPGAKLQAVAISAAHRDFSVNALSSLSALPTELVPRLALASVL